MNKAEKYDMKQAYNKNLRKSAEFNYLKNAMHDKKGVSMKDKGMMMKDKGMSMGHEGPSMMGQVKKGSMAMGRAGHVGSYTGNNMKLTAAGMMGESAGQERKNLLTDMPIDTRGTSMKSPMDMQKYGGNKGDLRKSAKKDYM